MMSSILIPTTTTTVPNLFHFKRVMPMAAAARFGAFRNLFGHISHHAHHRHYHQVSNHHVSNHHHAGQQMESLRHASAMSNVIMRNMSSSTAMGEPSQLVDPSADDFDERHRHYSMITVLAIMSLFILISISIVALILGFCRKNAVFSLGGTSSGGGSGGGHDRKRSRTGDNAISQFELDSLDAELDLDDIETKTCKEDRGGVCYYHLSGDDDDDDDDDDSIYDSDEDYFEVDDNTTTKNTNNSSEKNRSSSQQQRNKKKKQRGKRKVRKSKLRFRDSGYYYHLNNDEGGDDSSDDYSFHQNTNGEEMSLPKRSTTFPQLHSVLTSCIKGEPASSYHQTLLYNNPSTSSSSAATTTALASTSTSSSVLPPQQSSPTTPQCSYSNVSHYDKPTTTTETPSSFYSSSQNSAVKSSSELPSTGNGNTTNKITTRPPQCRQTKTTNDLLPTTINNAEIVACKEYCQKRTTTTGTTTTKDQLPRFHPTRFHITPKNPTISKLNVKKQTVLTVPHHHGRQQNAFVSSRRRRRLFKSYSFHDIPHNTTNSKVTKPVGLPPRRPNANTTGVTPSRPAGQGVTPHRVTFKVGTSLGDTDIRLHHV